MNQNRETVMAQAAAAATRDAHAFAGAVAVAPSTPVVAYAADDYEVMENYVFIKPDSPLMKTEQGIVLAGGKAKQDTAVILEMSKRMAYCPAGCQNGLQKTNDGIVVPCPVCLPSIVLRSAKVGDRIMCSKIFTFEINRETVFVVREADIIGLKVSKPSDALKLAE